jgi:hypothetical protein
VFREIVMKGPGTPGGTPVVVRFPLERLAITLAASALAAPLLIVLLRALGLPLPAAGVAVALALIAATPRVVRLLPPALDGVARWRPVLAMVWLIVALAAAFQTARLSTFMLDPQARGHSLFPGSAFYTRHWCASAYVEAARLARAGDPNIYDLGHYYPQGQPREVGPLKMDDFVYPPPFLLLPRLGIAFSDDPLRLRPIWFALTALLLAAAYLLAAAWIGGRAGRAVAWLFPVFWLSLPVQAGLQMGNFHLAMVALSVLAMLAFSWRRTALGGAMLAFAVAAKLSPAVLLVYLAVRRRWLALAWTGAFGLLLVAITWLVFGGQPFRSFFQDHLARLASGEAFSFVFDPQAMAARPGPVAGNLSLYGLVYKLQRLGVPNMTASLARAVSLAYLALVLVLAVFVARRAQVSQPDRPRLLLGWLALVSLGAFQAPFIPSNYGTLSVVWLVLVLAAGVRRPWPLAALATLWAMTWVLPSFLPGGPAMFGYGMMFQLVLMAVCVRQLVLAPPVPQAVRPPRRFLVSV